MALAIPPSAAFDTEEIPRSKRWSNWIGRAIGALMLVYGALTLYGAVFTSEVSNLDKAALMAGIGGLLLTLGAMLFLAKGRVTRAVAWAGSAVFLLPVAPFLLA